MLSLCITQQKRFSYLCIEDDISCNKVATQSHTSIGNDIDASKAVDRNTATCIKTLPIGIGVSFHQKQVWWKVDLSGVYSIYSINIVFKNYENYGMCGFFLISKVRDNALLYKTFSTAVLNKSI